MSKYLYIKTYGCQMNIYDSAKIRDMLLDQGYTETDNIEEADAVVFNTCHIREKATEKLYSDIGRLNKMQRKQNRKVTIIVAGCIAQAEQSDIFKRMQSVDIVIGPVNYHKLPELMLNLNDKKNRAMECNFLPAEKFNAISQKNAKTVGISEFLTIQEGCDKFCAYCVVPYTRGAEYSRPHQQIYDEAKYLVDNGAKDITLLGQNVSGYKDGGIALVDLMYELDKLNGLERMRYITSHPIDITQGIIDAHKNIPSLMPYLHLPVQSGSDKMLKEMNRHHDREYYFDIINKFKEARPDIALSSDFIVGYAGEEEEDFMDTLDLIEKVGYAQCYSFMYSIRKGTIGAKKKNQVEHEIKEERLTRLQAITDKQQEGFNKQFIGKLLPVLVESVSTKDENSLFGKSEYMQTVIIKNAGKSLIGEIVDVKIETAGNRELTGFVS